MRGKGRETLPHPVRSRRYRRALTDSRGPRDLGPVPKVGVAWVWGVRWGKVKGIEEPLPTSRLPGLIDLTLSNGIQARDPESRRPSPPRPTPETLAAEPQRGAGPGWAHAGRDRASPPLKRPAAPGRHPPRP